MRCNMVERIKKIAAEIINARKELTAREYFLFLSAIIQMAESEIEK